MFNLYLCAEMLVELAKREKQAGIFPEKDVDIFMKVIPTSHVDLHLN